VSGFLCPRITWGGLDIEPTADFGRLGVAELVGMPVVGFSPCQEFGTLVGGEGLRS
jgi:hypothetical protein